MLRTTLFSTLLFASVVVAADRPPNVVIIYADDLGYGDVGCFGNKSIRTPNIDRIATEGVRFTDFYVAQAVCSASRTALLTGCYPNRVGILGALNPSSRNGIHDNETTIAEVLKAQGLRDRDLRQVAPRPPRSVPADAPRLRRLFRPAILERHVAESPNRQVPATAAHRKREDDSTQPRPDAVDHLVHRAGGEVHRRQQVEAVLSLRPARDAACPALRLRASTRENRKPVCTAT